MLADGEAEIGAAFDLAGEAVFRKRFERITFRQGL